MPAFATAALQTAAIRIPVAPSLSGTFAAQELQRYLRQMTGAAMPIASDALRGGSHSLVLGPGGLPVETPALLQAGSFAITPGPTTISVQGGSPCALLAGVYRLLEQFGCRWSVHGPRDELVPRVTELVDIHSVQCTPAFAVRGYCADIMTWHYTQPEYFDGRLADDRAFIDWMGKSGANAFFFIRHPFDTQLTIPELVPDFQRRGIDVEYGGHVMPLLVPRELHREHPDYFPESPAGVRTDHGNLCTSNPAALATAAGNAVRYVDAYPEMSVVHVWGADLWRGGWCNCAACRSVSPQDQSLRVCNAVARGLAEAGVPRPVCYLAYHDTLAAELTLAPAEHVIVEFAPRERCYGHTLNDPGCETNRRYAAALERYVDLFAGRVRLFEYYGDAILFFGCAVPLTEVIAADLEYYRRLGVRDILMLQFGAFSVWAYPLNFLTFAARGTAGVLLKPVLEAYCARFGRHAATARALFAQLEGVMREVVTYGDIRRPPRAPEAAARLLGRLEPVLPRLMEVADQFAGLDDVALRAYAVLVRYTQAVLGAVLYDLQRTAVGQPKGPDEHYGEALHVLDAVERQFKGLWGSVDLPIIHSFYAAAAHEE